MLSGPGYIGVSVIITCGRGEGSSVELVYSGYPDGIPGTSLVSGLVEYSGTPGVTVSDTS